jgi:hypothetical protein
MEHQLFTLSNTVPTMITPLGNVHSGLDVTLQNVNGSGYIYFGGANTVTSTSYGHRLASGGSSISFKLDGHDQLFAISQGDAALLAVIKTSF